MFIDETGFLLTPVVRRTWAPVGQTPVLRHRARHLKKISCIGALTLSPRRRQPGLYLHLHEGRSITQDLVVEFLRDLLRHLRGEVTVIWDNLSQHRGRLVRDYVASRDRVRLAYLPPYAPELNPIEQVWANVKSRRLANHGADGLEELTDLVVRETTQVRANHDLLRGFVRASGLPLRL